MPLGAEPPLPQSNNIISKEAWIQKLQKQLPTTLCQAESNFISCFNITPQECITLSGWITQACLTHLEQELPAMLDNTEGEKWGSITGQCVGDLYHKFSSDKLKATAECKALADSPTKTSTSSPLSSGSPLP